MVLSHMVPGNRPEETWAACVAGFGGRLSIGHDLEVVGIGVIP
ncbi:Uncharacterised protein [Rhodococcus gordoniae]|uniref:Uncharacterized protein n=1 Tax=Rhodococcus gordoniae TaxID=223392 RepID=A0A379PQ34_9NOCA|nr:hypothetical protein [Rhodococcus sp. R1101]SUF09162.1 Uncharacterised protein [Rhodococcus gordoniae]